MILRAFFMEILRGLFGIAVLLGIAVLFSVNRRKIDWRLVAIGVVLQLTFGFLVTNVGAVRSLFDLISRGFVTLLSFSEDGAQFLFGDLARNSDANPELRHGLGFIFAFQVLPTVIFFSTVLSLL